MPAHGAQVAALVADAAPLVPDHPALRLRAHCVRKCDERLRVGGITAANDDCPSTPPAAPPRRTSPAPASVPSARTSTAFAPPKKRLRDFHCVTLCASISPTSTPASA